MGASFVTSELVCAVLVVDASGLVVAGNPAARNLGSTGHTLIGQPLVTFFRGANASTGRDLGAEWRGLRQDALDRWVPRNLARTGAFGAAVKLRLERAVGGAGSYIATIIPPAL